MFSWITFIFDKNIPQAGKETLYTIICENEVANFFRADRQTSSSIF